MAISQILYSQYLGFIWDSYVLGLKTKVFCRKKPNAQNHRQGTYSAKMGAVVWPKTHPNFLPQFVCPNQKSLGFS